MSLFNKSIYAYNPDDIIDLDGAFNEGSSQMISLSSIDDYQLNELTRALVTPTPNNKYQTPSSPYPESVLLFRDLKHDKTTVDFVQSDLKDFMGNYDMDDLASKVPSRITHNNSRMDHLLKRNPSTLQRRPPLAPSLLSHAQAKTNDLDQDKRSQLLSALELSYQREQQTEQIFLNQLKEIDIRAYEKLKKDSEAMMKRRSCLLQQFRAKSGPQKTRSSSNSTTTGSSHSNDLYYDPPEANNKKTDDIYPQDSISSTNEPISSSDGKKSVKMYKSQLQVIRSKSSEEKAKRQEQVQPKDVKLKAVYSTQPRRTEEPRIKNENYLSRSRRSVEEQKIKVDSYLSRPRRSTEEPKAKIDSYLSRSRRSAEEQKAKVDSYLTRPRRSAEEPKAKVDSYLSRPRRSIEEPKAKIESNINRLKRYTEEPKAKVESYSNRSRRSMEDSRTKVEDILNRHRPSCEEPKAKVDSYLGRHRRSTEESKLKSYLNRPRRSQEETRERPDSYPSQTRRSSKEDRVKNDQEDMAESDRAIALSYLMHGQKRNEQATESSSRLRSNSDRFSYLRRDSKEERVSYARREEVKPNRVYPSESSMHYKEGNMINNEEKPKRQSFLQSYYENKRNSQDASRKRSVESKTETEKVTESARRVLAMVRESRMKRRDHDCGKSLK